MAGKFTFFESFYEAFSDFPDGDRLELYDGLMRYVFEGVEPGFSGYKATIWKVVKPNVDTSVRRSRVNSENRRSKERSNEGSTVVKRNVATVASKDKDRDKEEEGEVVLPLEEEQPPRSPSGGAAPTDEATVPRCPMCGGTMRYDPSERLWRCRDGACRATVKPHELSQCFGSDEPGGDPRCPLCDSRIEPPSIPGMDWECPVCGPIKDGAVVRR